MGPSASDLPIYRPTLADLARHLFVVGQTGSGKTGFLVGTIEDVARAEIPVLVVDPKGDMAGMALRPIGYRAADLQPWLLGDAARAEAEASRWQSGLRGDGLDPVADVEAYRRSVPIVVRTPGSSVAPVDVVSSLLACPHGLAGDDDGRAAWLTGAVSALMALVGETADPLRDREVGLLAQVLGSAWESGESLDFPTLLARLVDPPFDVLGSFPTDKVVPPKAREELALRLNQVLAAPAFAAWRQGEPLDLDAWLAPGAGVQVLTLAHLGDAERSFFLTFLMHAVVAWTRRLPGTDRPRALIVIDEVYGFLPPNPHQPPSKGPILTLLKQARAVGVGLVLATQNVYDIDYRALSNCGTWALGRLLTAPDRERLIDGLGGDPADLHDRLAQLPPRAFVVRGPTARLQQVRTRWTLSWLRGPLTRAELLRLLPAPSVEPPPLPAGLAVGWLLSSEGLPGRGSWAPGADYAGALWATIEAGGAVVHRLWWPASARAAPVEVGVVGLLDGAPFAGRYPALPAWIDTAGEVENLRLALEGAVVREVVRWHEPRSDRWSEAGEEAGVFASRVGAEVSLLERHRSGAAAKVTAMRWIWVAKAAGGVGGS